LRLNKRQYAVRAKRKRHVGADQQAVAKFWQDLAESCFHVTHSTGAQARATLMSITGCEAHFGANHNNLCSYNLGEQSMNITGISP